jgi:hypothetical protein
MKKSLVISTLLINLATSFAWADIGDTYTCSITKFINMSHRGEITSLATSSFRFSRTAETVVFGANSFNNINSFDSKPFEITFYTDVNKEWFHAESFSHRLAYSDGSLFWTSAEAAGIQSFVAKCEIFD